MKKVILAFLFLVIAVAVNTLLNHGSKNVFNILEKSPTVTIDNATFSVMVAKTEADREKGLSGRNSMPQTEGMIFLFDKPDNYSFWMKDMKFPLDMIFINKDKIVDIFPSVPIKNQTDMETPREKADSVLEINAGLVKKYNFKIGDLVKTSL